MNSLGPMEIGLIVAGNSTYLLNLIFRCIKK